MKILTVLTYYRPHTSGLTIYAERLAQAFAKRGHQVTVMTTQYDPSLLLEETLDGVKIVRVPVAARISKGVIAPTFGLVATKLVAQHDVVQMHLPQFDAPGVALRGRLLGKPAVLTYHCDLLLPPGVFNRFVNAVVDFQNNMAGMLSNHIVTYTRDYADHSPYLSRYASKLTPILPPVELPNPLAGAVEAFAQKHHVRERRQNSFVRAITLPTAVNSDKANAEFDNGVLTLTLPKSEAALPKKISIAAKSAKK